MARVTIRDVAKQAGVGVATVSRVINDNKHVKDRTRQRVLEAIEALDYVPNVAARQLSGGKTLTIGIMTPFFTMPSFSERLAGIQQVLWDSAYDMVLYSVRNPKHLENKLHSLLRQNRVDGVILLTPPHLADEIWDANPHMPIVVVDSDNLKDRYPTLAVDNLQGGQIAGQFLIDRGHQKIGFIGDDMVDPFDIAVTRYRLEGLKTVLRQNNLPIEEKWYRFSKIGPSTRQQACEILSMEDRPTAIFAFSDVYAFDVLNVASEMGLRVPEDLAVIGFDDIAAASYMRLTTVRQHLYDSGKQAAQLMLDILNVLDMPEQLIYPQPLNIVERNTV